MLLQTYKFTNYEKIPDVAFVFSSSFASAVNQDENFWKTDLKNGQRNCISSWITMEPQRVSIDMNLQRAPTLLTANLLEQPSRRCIKLVAAFSEITHRVVNERGWKFSCNADQALFDLFGRLQFSSGRNLLFYAH